MKENLNGMAYLASPCRDSSKAIYTFHLALSGKQKPLFFPKGFLWQKTTCEHSRSLQSTPSHTRIPGQLPQRCVTYYNARK